MTTVDKISDKTFVDWSHQVLQQLVALNARVESLDEKQELLRSGIDERYTHIEKKLDKVNDLLNGNGTPEKGLVIRVDRLEQKGVDDLDVRVDRLEQKENSRTWLLRTTVVACVGTIVATAANYFKSL